MLTESAILLSYIMGRSKYILQAHWHQRRVSYSHGGYGGDLVTQLCAREGEEECALGPLSVLMYVFLEVTHTVQAEASGRVDEPSD